MADHLARGIEGKVMLITGGYGGIAMATADLLLRMGGKVVLTGRNEAKGAEAIAKLKSETGGEAHFYAMDVADAAAVEAVAERVTTEVGTVQGLVANAASAWPGAAFDLSPEDWRKTIGVNLDGAFYCAQSFGKRMRGAGGGSIVLVSSVAATKVTWPPAVVSYSVSKAGMSHLAALLGCEWASDNIRVNALEPGHINTDMTKRAKERRPDLLGQWIDSVPQKRLIEPEEVADTIAFLLSDMSSSMTASVLTADGGYSRR